MYTSLFLYRWLKRLNEYGVCLVTDIPTNIGEVRKVRTGLYLVYWKDHIQSGLLEWNAGQLDRMQS